MLLCRNQRLQFGGGSPGVVEPAIQRGAGAAESVVNEIKHGLSHNARCAGMTWSERNLSTITAMIAASFPQSTFMPGMGWFAKVAFA